MSGSAQPPWQPTGWPDILFVRNPEICLIVAHPVWERSVAHIADHAWEQCIQILLYNAGKTFMLRRREFPINVMDTMMLRCKLRCFHLGGGDLPTCLGCRSTHTHTLSCKIRNSVFLLCSQNLSAVKTCLFLWKLNYGIMSLSLIAPRAAACKRARQLSWQREALNLCAAVVMEVLEQLGGYGSPGIVGDESSGRPFTPWPQNSSPNEQDFEILKFSIWNLSPVQPLCD